MAFQKGHKTNIGRFKVRIKKRCIFCEKEFKITSDRLYTSNKFCSWKCMQCYFDFRIWNYFPLPACSLFSFRLRRIWFAIWCCIWEVWIHWQPWSASIRAATSSSLSTLDVSLVPFNSTGDSYIHWQSNWDDPKEPSCTFLVLRCSSCCYVRCRIWTCRRSFRA